MNATLLEVDVDLIDPNPEQPRELFDQAKLEELAQSIVANGLQQAISVEIKTDGRYMLRDGERRLRAHKLAGLPTILAMVTLPPATGDNPLQDYARERLIGAFVANFQREQLNPVEEAKSIRRMNGELGMTYQEIAEKLGTKKSTVANKVRLLALPDEWLEALAVGLVSERQAAAFLPWLALPEEIKVQTDHPVGMLWDETLQEGKSSEQIRRELNTIIYQASKSLDRVVWFDQPIDDPFCAQNICRGCVHSVEATNNRLGCVNLQCFARKTDHFRAAAAKLAEVYDVPLLPVNTEWYEVTIHYSVNADDIDLVDCPNRAILAYPWLTISDGSSGRLAPGIFLVCKTRSCGCVSRAKRLNGKQKPPADPEPVKPFWLHITTGEREWVIERGGQGVRLSVSDVLEIVNRYCDEHGMDLARRVELGQEFPKL